MEKQNYGQLMTREQWEFLARQEELYMEQLSDFSFKWKGHTDSVMDDDAEIERLIEALFPNQEFFALVLLSKKEAVLDFLKQVV